MGLPRLENSRLTKFCHYRLKEEPEVDIYRFPQQKSTANLKAQIGKLFHLRDILFLLEYIRIWVDSHFDERRCQREIKAIHQHGGYI